MATTNDPAPTGAGANYLDHITIPARLLAAVLHRANPHNGGVQIDASEPADLAGQVATVASICTPPLCGFARCRTAARSRAGIVMWSR